MCQDIRVSIEDAASALWNEFHERQWFVMVGEGRLNGGQVALLLYVTRSSEELKTRFSSGWMGYPVSIVVSGRPKPLKG